MVITRPTTFEVQAPFDAMSIGTAVVCCSDGRFVGPMDEFLHQGLGISRYDCLTVPGGAACLAGHFAAWREEEAVTFQLKFLIEMHALHRIVLIAHPDCGFYSKRLRLFGSEIEEQERRDIVTAAHRIRSLAPRLEIDAFVSWKLAAGMRFDTVNLGR
jgi:hypothetical protein